jgi:uncharacterized protein (TIGR03435 family)
MALGDAMLSWMTPNHRPLTARMALAGLLWLGLFSFGALAQTADLKFEIASVKATSGVLPDGRVVIGMLPPTGGPGTDSPGRIRYPAASLKILLLKAFDVQDADLRGPSWLDDQFFEVIAIMPSDTTGEQFRAMLRNLLAERFKLTAHREAKATSGYILTVAKNGPKIQESSGDMPPLDEQWVAKTGKDGFVVPRRGQRFFVQNGPLQCRWTYQHAPMRMLVGGLAQILGSPVEDATGLTKEYNLSLTFRTAGTSLESGPGLGRTSWGAAGAEARPDLSAIDAVPDIFGAVQLLGLKLERNTSSKETIIIDHIEKLPTSN